MNTSLWILHSASMTVCIRTIRTDVVPFGYLGGRIPSFYNFLYILRSSSDTKILSVFCECKKNINEAQILRIGNFIKRNRSVLNGFTLTAEPFLTVHWCAISVLMFLLWITYHPGRLKHSYVKNLHINENRTPPWGHGWSKTANCEESPKLNWSITMIQREIVCFKKTKAVLNT